MRYGTPTLLMMVLLIGTGCSAPTSVARGTDPPSDPIIGMLTKRITQLTANISALSARLNEVPPPADAETAMRELHELELLGWRLHQKQWILQRDYLLFVRDQLVQAQRAPGDTARLLNAWRERRDAYTAALAGLRQQRQELERQHAEAEARLIERRFQ